MIAFSEINFKGASPSLFTFMACSGPEAVLCQLHLYKDTTGVLSKDPRIQIPMACTFLY